MIITVLSVSAPVQVKKYFTLEIAYKDESGKVQGKKLMSFTYPLVFNTAKTLQPGDQAEVTLLKEGDFWNWTELKKLEGGAQAATPASASKTASFAASSGDRYETKEERIARQKYIIRQSSLSTAVETLAVGSKVALDPQAVIAVARQYEDYVFGVNDQPQSNTGSGFEDMQDDIPY